MDNDIISAWEYFFIFSQPTLVMSPVIIVTMYLAVQGFKGQDGMLNESREGWNVIAAAMAWMALCMYHGARNVNVFYGLGEMDNKTFWISVIITTGGVVKITTNALTKIIDFFTRGKDNR